MSGSGVLAPPFLTSEAEGSEWSSSRLGRLISGNRALGTHWIKGSVGPRGCLDVMKRKISEPCQESNQVCPAAASRYNDWAKYAVLLQICLLLFPVTFWHLCTFVKVKIHLTPCLITHYSATNLKSEIGSGHECKTEALWLVHPWSNLIQSLNEFRVSVIISEPKEAWRLNP